MAQNGEVCRHHFIIMKILSAKKITLFDGDQEELFQSDHSIKCPLCHEDINFKPSACQPLSDLHINSLSEILTKLKGLKTIDMGDSKFYKVDNLPLRHIYIDCAQCNEKYLGLFGIGEYQPARFIFKLVSLISTE